MHGMESDTMTELRKCPFCGGEAKIYRRQLNWLLDDYKVECCSCCCSTDIYDTKQEAIEAWNKRVTPTTKEIEEYIEKTHNENVEMVAKLKRKYEVES